MVNVYQQITNNKIRSGIIVSLFIVFIGIVAYIITYSLNLDYSFLVIALIFSIFSSSASYFWGDKIVLSLNQARPATRKEFFDFYTVTENLSLANQTPTPKIYIIPFRF